MVASTGRNGKTVVVPPLPLRILTSATPMAGPKQAGAWSYALTERQIETLDFIRRYIKKASYPPARSEIARALGLKNPSAVGNHLIALEKKGWLKLSLGVERGIKLLREGAPLYEPDALYRGVAGVEGPDDEPYEPQWIDDDHLWKMCGAMPDLCVHIRGDAMDKAGLTDGGIVALKMVRDRKDERAITDGQVVLARIEDQILLRRYHRLDERTVELKPQSSNRRHKAIRISTRSKDVELIGVVIGRMLPGAG